MDFCTVTVQISKFPHESVKKWGIETVRDFITYKAHVDKCLICKAVMDAVLEEHKDTPRCPDPTSLN